MLRSFPKAKWDVKVTAIREAKDIETITLNELVGNLRTYEMNIEGQKKEMVAGEKSLALKVASDDEGSYLDEDQIAFLAKNFKKFLRKEKGRDKREIGSRKWSENSGSKK